MKCKPPDMVPLYNPLLLTEGKVQIGSPLITWLLELASIQKFAGIWLWWLAGIAPALDCNKYPLPI